MNEQQMATVCRYIAGNWPGHHMSEDTVTILELELAARDFEQTMAVLRTQFAGAEHPPTPAGLRVAVDSAGRAPEPAPQELMAELHGLVEKHGSYGVRDYNAALGDGKTPGPSIGFGRVPPFSHPAMAAFVDQNGGWEKVCEAMNQQGKDPTQAAQMREHMKVCIAREREREQRAELGRGAAPELEGQ